MSDDICLILADDKFTHPRQLVVGADVLWQAKQQDETFITNITARLSEHDLAINLAKCQFGLSPISFLGHCIDQHRAIPLPAKVDAIHKFPKPTTMKGFQEFIGIVTLYHHFIPAATKIVELLFQLLTSKSRKLIWTNAASITFENTKAGLANSTMMVHPQADAPTTLMIDTSETVMGGVLEQLVNGEW
ncbi:hypothetical protein O3P69_019905 [Scylla paramamosain]|uniref:Reverse transcriptase/retrotransposon-derived protein RNase H-like domain-containing protein n=1 Tax=Scylla paramamosain TaxID=85552 RepID=A0AAW0SE49_SCYPA